jgi:NADH-quinone oxidoreductase subunit N
MSLYVIATLGLFAGLLSLRRKGQPLDDVSDLNGLLRHKPGVALGLMTLIFSVAGIPPAVGFWGKVQVFEAALRTDLLWLVLVGALSSVVSLGYYLRLVWAMMMKPPGEALDASDFGSGMVVAVTALLSFPALTILIGWVFSLASRAGLG